MYRATKLGGKRGLWPLGCTERGGVDDCQEDGCPSDGRLRCNFSQERGLVEDGLAQPRYPSQKGAGSSWEEMKGSQPL